MWASRPPLQPQGMNVGDSPSFAATEDECGRVAHTPIAVNAPAKYPDHTECFISNTPSSRERLAPRLQTKRG